MFVQYLKDQEYQNLWPKPIDRNCLNAVFLNGPARTLWLTGIHQRRSIRADAKTLMGINIRDALNPLDDQSFYFTSARCYQKDWKKTTGVSPEKSQIWIRKTQNWNDYCALISEVLGRLKNNSTKSDDSPFSILAVPQTDLKAIHTAFDMNFLYPEAIAEDAIEDDQDLIKLLETLSYNTNFDITEDSTSPNLSAIIFHEEEEIGKIEIDFKDDLRNKRNWDFVFTPGSSKSKNDPILRNMQSLVRNGRFLQIRYESGHTFSGGDFFLQKFGEYRFEGWKFFDFDGYSITKEKPSAFSKIGQDKSLFCWVWNLYSDNCWIYCDDGSGEIADFIKLEMGAETPNIFLIHVKAAHGSGKRKFSVSNYEVVTAQAVKNLRHFEIENMIEKIQGKDGNHFLYRIKNKGKIPQDVTEAEHFRDEFIKDLKKAKTNVQRVVIVLQPHNRSSVISNDRVNKNALCQLNTLLLSTENTCKSLGAKFYVISEK